MSQENTEYFGYVRTDVLRHVPKASKAVLSIGCGYGNTEKLLVERGMTVTGIEPSNQAAPVASQNGIHVIQKGAEEGLAELKHERFDCILLSDVLEHLYSPQEILKACSGLITPEGIFVVSVPNFRHYSVFYNLFIRGSIPDRDAGIFDKTHIQITTMKRMEEWLVSADTTILEKEYKFGRRLEVWLSKLSLGLLNEFIAPQVILSASKN